MKIATIVPQTCLKEVQKDNYFMALAHLVDKEGMEKYTNFMHNQGMDPAAYVIMDNGVIEGDQQSIQEILRKAELICADEIILTDVFLNCDETVDATFAAYNTVKQQNPDIKVMVVPQGNDVDEWLYCLEQMIHCGIRMDCIGIPKVLTKLEGRDARIEALERLNEVIDTKEEGVEIHLLGCHKNVLEAKRIEQLAAQGLIPPVRGIDSAIAYVYTRAGKHMTECSRPDSKEIDFEKGDVISTDLLKENIEFWKSEIRGEYLKASKDGVIKVNF